MRTVIFDIESNGLLHKEDFQPVEFSCLVVKGDIIKEQDVLIKCAGTIDDKAFEAHKLSKEYLNENGIEYETFLKGLDQILFHKEVTRIVGHNIIGFDIPAVEKILNKEVNKDLIFDTAAHFKAELLGLTVKSNYYNHKYVLGLMRKGVYFNLSKAIEHYKIPPIKGELHRALTDTKYSYEIYKKQIDK